MPPKKPPRPRRDFNKLLEEMAVIIEAQMVAFGSDPRNPTDVDVFVNGLSISKKLKKLLTEAFDQE